MDILIFLIGAVFLGLLGAGFYIFLKEPKETAKGKIQTKEPESDVVAALQKKISNYETKINNLEYDLEATKLDLAQTKEKEKALLTEIARVTFDAEQYEKLKKDHQALKAELPGKEEMLEKEISSRRLESAELAQLKTELQTLKKKAMETEDSFRKSQMTIEAFTKELNLSKKTIEEQKRIVKEHSENKVEGEWVSRIEFNKIEKELREKEALLQRFLSNQPPQQDFPKKE